MSAENCPLKLIRENHNFEREKHHYLELDMPLDPNNPNGLKVSNKFKKLIHTDAESVLEFIIEYDGIVEDLNIPEGVARFRLFEALIHSNAAKSAWSNIRGLHTDTNQPTLELCIDLWTLKFMTRDISLDTKEYLRIVKKPRQWTVAKLNDRLQTLNNLITWMPAPVNGGDFTPRFSDDELKVILQNCCPRAWKKTMVRAAYRPTNLTEQTQYFEGLRSLEEDNHQEHGRSRRNRSNTGRNDRNNNKNDNNKGRRSSGRGNNNKNDNSKDHQDAICPIHGGHTIKECTLIRNERQRYQERKGNNRTNNNRVRGNGNDNRRNYGYNTRNSTHRNEDNNNISEMNGNDTEDEASEMNNIYEEMNTVQRKDIKKLSNPTLSEVSVELASSKKMVLGLLDSGATGVHVKRSVLSLTKCTLASANIHVTGRYGKSYVSETATFNIKLPDFCRSRSITVTANIDDNAVGRHDIIFGVRFLTELGLVFDFKRHQITWDELVVPMKPIQSIPIPINSITQDKHDDDAPSIVKKAIHRSTRGTISANKYKEYNYVSMINKCAHLTSEQRNDLLRLFSQYEELFSGDIGEVPGEEVHLELKPNAKPYNAPAYSIPQAFYQTAKDEIEELVKKRVLIKNVRTDWASPSFFRPKKNGGVRFVSDFRKLNEQLIRRPFPLPNIDDVIWRMNGFTFATCLDLNRGYYHFVLDSDSQKLCGIILPWGNYAYRCLPQGCVVASDVFQYKMIMIFSNFEDIIVYIDNILLYTKKTFQHHLQRLELVLQQLRKNNLHVHVEETFLASQKVDYLGYTLTPTGIEPQVKKILPILRFTQPTNKKQLKSFLGFINYYKKHWHHRSHIIEPLTRITSTKVNFKWTNAQTTAFNRIKQIMARKILLTYPDFTKTFHLFTDASYIQLGRVIVQEGKPISFYSRKLTPPQKNYTVMEKELLSIVETTESHRSILVGFPLVFHSDHKNLSFDNFKSERVHRWRLLLE